MNQNAFGFADRVVTPTHYAVILSLKTREKGVKILSLKREVQGTELFADDLDHKIPDQSIIPHDGVEVDLFRNFNRSTAEFLYQHLVVQCIQTTITRFGDPRDHAVCGILE